jgi:hypothetical protein
LTRFWVWRGCRYATLASVKQTLYNSNFLSELYPKSFTSILWWTRGESNSPYRNLAPARMVIPVWPVCQVTQETTD